MEDVLEVHHRPYDIRRPQRIAERLELHYTPKHGRWLNAAEGELSHLSRQCLNRRIPDMASLKEEVAAGRQARNNDVKALDWQFTEESASLNLIRQSRNHTSQGRSQESGDRRQ